MRKITAINDIANAVDASNLLDRPISNWRDILAEECQVFVFGENYLAKRFDAINFKFCEKNEAKEVLIDNLYALLRYKYFPITNEEIDDKIQKIVSNFTLNLKTTLKKVSFDADSGCNVVHYLPDTCVAFRNGVYDFWNDKWLFKYDVTYIEAKQNYIYQYNPDYIITWYFNLDFEPFGISIKDTPLDEFIEIMKDYVKEDRNYCFELLYNMSHDIDNKFSYNKFLHLCEILGFTLQTSFNQNFVILIGNGGNGKNSLFDGCFVHKVVPTPTSNSIESFEKDKFITGTLENKAHNIYLETGDNTIEFNSERLKNITGSMYQTVEIKGVQKYSSLINCKNIWSANDQEKLKFRDTTQGFRRRINIYEIFYSWDDKKRFLKKGDYYDTTFSDSLKEIKQDVFNTIMYVYFGMYGLMSATKNFINNFKFSFNDWNLQYTDVDISLKDRLEQLTMKTIVDGLQRNFSEEFKYLFYTTNKRLLYSSVDIKNLGYKTFKEFAFGFLGNEDNVANYFLENDVYLNLKLLQRIIGESSSFTSKIKKLYNIKVNTQLYNNQPYAKIRVLNDKVLFIN